MKVRTDINPITRTQQPKAIFVTNFCPHYRVKTFELLAKKHPVEFVFYSKGEESYWMEEHGISRGQFPHEYLKGFKVAGVRITPELLPRLFSGEWDIFISGMSGRVALPATFLTAKLKRKPFILWTGVWSRLSSGSHRLMHPFLKLVYHQASSIVTYGSHVLDYLSREGVDPNKVFVAPHAVENEDYNRSVPETQLEAARARHGIEDGRRIVLYVGRLVEEKGVQFLLEAFSRLKGDSTILLVVGEGDLSSTLKDEAQRLGIENRTEFIGYIAPDRMPIYYALADLLVVPSITTDIFKEPWGLVVNEAFNQGLPVVATNAVGAAAGGMVKESENGIIVPERDAGELSAAIEKVIANPLFREELSHGARQTVKEYTNEGMIQTFTDAIRYSLGDRKVQ